MVWSAKSVKGRDRDYIVIRHKLRDIDDTVQGVRFRRGFGVVDKSTKMYTTLKKLPFLKNALEFPLIHLQNLPFIINDRQVDFIYGRDVYTHYIKAKKEYLAIKEVEDKQKEEVVHLESESLCKFRRDSGELCKNEFMPESPSNYCTRHLLEDPLLAETVNMKIPSRLSKQEKKEWKEKVLKKLKK